MTLQRQITVQGVSRRVRWNQSRVVDSVTAASLRLQKAGLSNPRHSVSADLHSVFSARLEEELNALTLPKDRVHAARKGSQICQWRVPP